MRVKQRTAGRPAADRRYRWTGLDDTALLHLQFRDLQLRVADSVVWADVQRLYAELDRRGIRFKPHVWLSEEWFSPDGCAVWNAA